MCAAMNRVGGLDGTRGADSCVILFLFYRGSLDFSQAARISRLTELGTAITP
jgi:hypothetical protein